MSKPTANLTCTIDRIEDQKIVVRFNLGGKDHQELVLAKKYLPKDSKEGDIFTVEFLSDRELSQKQKNLAREILREILSGK